MPKEPIDVVLMSDRELLRLHNETLHAMDRRCPSKLIDASSIKGHESPKRALSIAIAGGHSILFVGSHGVGKSMLRSVGGQFGFLKSFEALSCVCGNRGSPNSHCGCVESEIEEVVNAWPRCDLFMECAPVSVRELQTNLNGTSTAQLKESIDRAIAFRRKLGKMPDRLDADAESILKCAALELEVSPRQVAGFIYVAGTIAAMDESEVIRFQHISEACNCRMPFLC